MGNFIEGSKPTEEGRDPIDSAIETAQSKGAQFADEESVRTKLLECDEEGMSVIVIDDNGLSITFTRKGNGFEIDIPDEK